MSLSVLKPFSEGAIDLLTSTKKSNRLIFILFQLIICWRIQYIILTLPRKLIKEKSTSTSNREAIAKEWVETTKATDFVKKEFAKLLAESSDDGGGREGKQEVPGPTVRDAIPGGPGLDITCPHKMHAEPGKALLIKEKSTCTFSHREARAKEWVATVKAYDRM